MNYSQRAKKLSQVRGERTLVVGVDIAKHKHWGQSMDGLTELPVGSPFPIQNSREGFERLLGQIARAQEKIGATRVVVAMEPSGHYWKPLAAFLRQAGIKVVTVNPFHVKRAKEFDDNSPTKNDQKDAWVIARRANDGDFFDPYLPEGVYADLRALTQARQQHRAKLNQALNQFQALLDEYFPEFGTVFADPLGQAASYLLRNHPFPTDVLNLSVEQLSAELKTASNSRVGLKRAIRVREAARGSIGVTEGLTAARIRLRQHLEEMAFWHSQMAETEMVMAQALKETGLAPYLLSVPGVGVVTAAGLLGEAGDLKRFEDWRQLRKLAGYNLAENSSGQQHSKTHITKRGRPGLRSLLYQAALILVARNPQFKVLYQHFKNRDQNRLAGKQALVAIACKLLRVLFTLATQHCYYDPAKVLGGFRTQQLGLAA